MASAGVFQRMRSQFAMGVGESFGFQYGNKSMIKQGYQVGAGQNLGFMGRKTPQIPGLKGTGGMFGQGKLAFGSSMLGLAGVAFAAHRGYQENGIAGAIYEPAKDAALWGAARAGWTGAKAVLGSPFVIGGAVLGAGAYAGYKIGEASRDKAKRIRNVEMGADIIDRFGTMGTIRQRSLQALNNSHVNGRMALGNEAILMNSPYLR